MEREVRCKRGKVPISIEKTDISNESLDELGFAPLGRSVVSLQLFLQLGHLEGR